jgi:hypothetical protein
MVLMWVLQVIETVDLLLVAHQREADRHPELEAMFNGELLVDRLHHGHDFSNLALGPGKVAASGIKEMHHRFG